MKEEFVINIPLTYTDLEKDRQTLCEHQVPEYYFNPTLSRIDWSQKIQLVSTKYPATLLDYLPKENLFKVHYKLKNGFETAIFVSSDGEIEGTQIIENVSEKIHNVTMYLAIYDLEGILISPRVGSYAAGSYDYFHSNDLKSFLNTVKSQQASIGRLLSLTKLDFSILDRKSSVEEQIENFLSMHNLTVGE